MPKNRMTIEHKALASNINEGIVRTAAEVEAAKTAFRSFKRADGVLDLTSTEAMDANRRLFIASEDHKRALRMIIKLCPPDERDTCSRCAGEGRVHFSTLMGGVCLKCSGRTWNPSKRWVKACEPAL